MKLIRYAPHLLIGGALLALVVWGVAVLRERDQLRSDLVLVNRELTGARQVIEQAQEARRVHILYLEQAEAEAARWATIANELQGMEGRDAPLSDLLRSTAERVWP